MWGIHVGALCCPLAWGHTSLSRAGLQRGAETGTAHHSQLPSGVLEFPPRKHTTTSLEDSHGWLPQGLTQVEWPIMSPALAAEL